MTKKLMQVGIIAVCVGLLICSIASAAPQDITISFAGWIMVEPEGASSWNLMKETFEETHPNVRIRYIGTSYEDAIKQAIIQGAAANSPDILELHTAWCPQLAALGLLKPVDRYYSAAELDDMFAVAVDGCRYQENLVAVPWDTGSIVLLGHKGLIERAGYNPNKPPETWEDFEEMVDKITDLGTDEKGERVFGFGARAQRTANNAFWFAFPLFAYGGRYVNEEDKITFYSPETVGALGWYKHLAETKASPIGMGTREVRQLFAHGRVGFIFDGPWMRGILRKIAGTKEIDGKYFTAVPPKGKDGKVHSIGNNHVLAVSTQCKHPNIASEFIKHIIQDREVTSFYHEQMGIPPSLKSLLEASRYQDSYTKPFIETAPFAVQCPSKNPLWQRALEFVAVAMQGALLGRDTEKAAQEADNGMRVLYGQEPRNY